MRIFETCVGKGENTEVKVNFVVNGLTETPPIENIELSDSEWGLILKLINEESISLNDEDRWIKAATILKPLFIFKLQGNFYKIFFFPFSIRLLD